jgi:hypothetical protein
MPVVTPGTYAMLRGLDGNAERLLIKRARGDLDKDERLSRLLSQLIGHYEPQGPERALEAMFSAGVLMHWALREEYDRGQQLSCDALPRLSDEVFNRFQNLARRGAFGSRLDSARQALIQSDQLLVELINTKVNSSAGPIADVCRDMAAYVRAVLSEALHAKDVQPG